MLYTHTHTYTHIYIFTYIYIYIYMYNIFISNIFTYIIYIYELSKVYLLRTT